MGAKDQWVVQEKGRGVRGVSGGEKGRRVRRVSGIEKTSGDAEVGHPGRPILFLPGLEKGWCISASDLHRKSVPSQDFRVRDFFQSENCGVMQSIGHPGRPESISPD